jgi:hypothetical protein
MPRNDFDNYENFSSQQTEQLIVGKSAVRSVDMEINCEL